MSNDDKCDGGVTLELNLDQMATIVRIGCVSEKGVRDLYAHAKELQVQLETAEDNAARYESALKTIQQWDAINPPPSDGSDLPWLRRLVDEALNKR